jgi:uncharacterized protein
LSLSIYFTKPSFRPLDISYLAQIRQHYPMTLHGVGLSIGSTDPLNQSYLQKLKNLAVKIKPEYISDHLCWISVDDHYLHDLLPLPYTEEAVQHVVTRIQNIQDYLGQRILIENVSSYLEYKINEMSEWQFINTIAEQADCFILLDINNIYVSSKNHNFAPIEYLNHINPERVKQFHLAGYEDKGKYLFDTHSKPVHLAVWELYKIALQRFGPVPTSLEWDDHIPSFPELHAEAQKAEILMQEYVLDSRVRGNDKEAM